MHGSLRLAATAYHEDDFPIESIASDADGILIRQAEAAEGGTGCSIADFPASNWESFHALHRTGQFFKERRYMPLAFPELTEPKQCRRIVELGCGCGATLVPLLKANPAATAVACDVSLTAVAQLPLALEMHGIPLSRVSAVVHDITRPCELLAEARANACLLVFTLSAVPPGAMRDVLALALATLQPGGKLMVRDYGKYDLTSLRFPPKQRLGDCLYHRADGTLAYFFTTDDLKHRCQEAGFLTISCKYVRTLLFNRKNGKDMKRVFVQGVFAKPL